MTTDPTRMRDLADLLVRRVARRYGDGPRIHRLRAALVEFADVAHPVDAGRLADVQRAAQTVFRHLELTHGQGLRPETDSPGWPAPDLAAIRRAGADIASVTPDADGTAVLRLTGLAPVQAAAPLLAHALGLLRNADQVVLDLRDNGGGDPATVALIVDWLAAGPPRHLFDVIYRDRIRQWWTGGTPVASPPDAPVRALIGPRTYSSGEALAWAVQDQGLATLVGAPTAGAADHVVPLALTHDVHALIPEAHVAAPDGGPTWEGTGVRPDQTTM